MEDELIITAENFDQYYKDVRRFRPERGEIMVCYAHSAELVLGNEKRHLVYLLKLDGKIEAATQVMRKLLFACEQDAYRVPKMILQDMIAGMSEEEILNKSYPYTVHIFYYTKPEYMDRNDPHWTSISLIHLDEFLDTAEKKPSRESPPLSE